MVGKFGDGEDQGRSKMVARNSWGCFTCLNVLLVFGGKKAKVPKPQKNSRILRVFAFGMFCQVTQQDAIFGIFLLRLSKPPFSDVLMITLLKWKQMNLCTLSPWQVSGVSRAGVSLGTVRQQPDFQMQSSCGTSHFFSTPVWQYVLKLTPG